MRDRQLAVAVAVTSTVMLAACNPVSGGTDMAPVGSGITFLGLSVVLASLILAFSKYLTTDERMKYVIKYVPMVLFVLLLTLAVVAAAKALPMLFIPLLTVIAVIIAVVLIQRLGK